MTPATPRTRRRLVFAAGISVGVAALAAGALATAGLAVDGGDGATAAAEQALKVKIVRGQPLVEPPVISPRKGVTRLDLTSKTAATMIAGSKAISNVYNSLFPGPTVRVRPGDRLEINLENGGQYHEPTNLHTHGMHVDPKNPGDNVFLNLPTNGEHSYRYNVPKDHVPGLLWYHPHRHEYTQTQVFAGQAGAIEVMGGLDDLPGVGNLRDRLMVFQAVQFDTDGRPLRSPSDSDPAKQLQLINGQLNPTVDIRPGETQRWRLLNASSDKFLVLRLQGHSMYIIADDGNPRAVPEKVTTQFIGPGERREFLVKAGRTPGDFKLESMFFAPVRAQPSYSSPTRVIATMRIAGTPVASRPIPTKLLPVKDLRGAHVDRRRKIVFSESQTSPNFYINGKEFDPSRVDQTMRLNTVEEWTIVNTTDEWHTFHIHINPYQVTKINGRPVKGITWDDNVVVGPYGGTVTMRTRFTDFTGKFVIHCHVLFHEDHGMMSAVRVVR